jgi:hypothetical protein
MRQEICGKYPELHSEPAEDFLAAHEQKTHSHLLTSPLTLTLTLRQKLQNLARLAREP